MTLREAIRSVPLSEWLGGVALFAGFFALLWIGAAMAP
jgi:hypothetical protein